ncbi:hypothetical protein GCM10010136_16100 [Limoniibacter endophyticus]|uniref:NAD-dependent epimerase/dehydratase domain-containing protein n=1 Tax=Limoniibacter endophyticus TaxID=1565040 RepID=A0A8J3DID2_9HYPH|nr:hypothetical protein GCM10010136_16100 [Limoniibacter endophyticus]
MSVDVPEVDTKFKFDLFINLAAVLKTGPDNIAVNESATARIAANVSNFILAADIPRAIVISTVAASVAENGLPNARRYGLEKLEADRIFLEKLRDRELAILRPPAVYGPGMQSSLSALASLIRKRMPIPLGRATAPRHYISLVNLCSLIKRIACVPSEQWPKAGPVWEVSDGQPISTSDLVEMLGQVMGRPALLVPLPLALLRLAGRLSGQSELVSSAIDELAISEQSALTNAFGWEPIERMPDSLCFLREGDGHHEGRRTG